MSWCVRVCVCVFVREEQMNGDKVFTYTCVRLSVGVGECARVADDQPSVNEQNVDPGARVYTFPSVDLKGPVPAKCTQGPVCAKLE